MTGSGKEADKLILLVEDEAVTAKSVSAMLEKNGYRSVTARTGSEGVEIALAEENLGLILMDIELGDGIDGIGASIMILEKRKLPIVFFTSHPEKDFVDRVKGITRYGYVLKNSGHSVLLSSIEMALELFDIQNEKQASEEKYRLIFDYSPLGLVHYDTEGVITSCNNVFVNIIGSSREVLIGLDMFKLPDIKIKDAVRMSLDGNHGYFNGVYKSFTADKSTPVRIVFVPLKSADSRVTGGVGVIEDVTESKSAMDLLKKSNEELEASNEELTATNEEFEAINEELISANQDQMIEKQKSEERERNYREIFNSSNDAIFIHDSKTGTILDVNQTMIKMYGFENKDEVLNESFNNLNAANEGYSQKKAKDMMKKALDVESNTFEWRAKKKNGDIFWCEVSLKSTLINGEKRIMATVRDITERKISEDALHESKLLFYLLIESLPQSIYAKDIDGRFIFANKNFCSLHYRPLEEIIGKTDFELHPAELAEKYLADDKHVIETGAIIELEEEHQVINGEKKFVQVLKTPFYDSTGQIGGTLGIFWDITEKRRFEETVQNAQKLESLGVLAGGIAHDFNNFLGGIFGSLELAKLKNKDNNITGYFDGALNSIERARGLTQQLLTFSRGGTPVMKPGNLTPFIQDTVQFALSGSNAFCRFNIPEDLPHCFFDKNQVGQVIDNLIINAQQSMPMGGIIDVDADIFTVFQQEHPLLKAGNYVRISVKDRGVGIPKEMLSFIFDPFYSTKAKGHGLGLATCYSIINRHCGAIDVESVPGAGSTFHIFLPVSTEHESTSEVKPVIGHKGIGKIIVMDDEELILNILSEMLSEFGYSADVVKDGKEAVDFFIKGKSLNYDFTAMIFDLTVPGGVGGVEAVREIRKLDREIPVFVSSGYSEDPVMANPQEFGFTASIRKPFQISELSEMLDKHIVKK